jgi:hypothetical protein
MKYCLLVAILSRQIYPTSVRNNSAQVIAEFKCAAQSRLSLVTVVV